MRIILQRVSGGSLVVGGNDRGSIKTGIVALVGFTEGDSQPMVDFMVNKMIGLRIFDDENGNLNLSLDDVSGEIMVVSNFTLYASSKKGRRPSFTDALVPGEATVLNDYFIEKLKIEFSGNIVSGDFGADMNVSLTNDGPVTIILDSKDIYTK